MYVLSVYFFYLLFKHFSSTKALLSHTAPGGVCRVRVEAISGRVPHRDSGAFQGGSQGPQALSPQTTSSLAVRVKGPGTQRR